MESLSEQWFSPNSVLRTLSRHEAMFATMGMSATFWGATQLRGELDIESLRSAWELVRAAHPVLAARIMPTGEDLALVAGHPAPAIVEILSKPVPDLSAMPALTFQDGTAALKVHSQKQSHTVLLGLDHGVSDARLGAYYLFLLWHFYTQIVSEGIAPQISPSPVPEAPETALERRGVPKSILMQKEWFTTTEWAGKQSWTVDGQPGQDITWKHRFDKRTTHRLRLASKRFGTTIHGLITGAIAVAERGLIPAPPEEPVNMGFISPVDFRAHLTPAANITDISVGIAMAISQTRVRADDDPVQIGREIVQQIQDDLAAGVIQQSTHHMESILLANSYGPLITVTNPGVILTPPLPDTLTIEDFRGQLVLIPSTNVAAAAPPLPYQASGYEVYTFNDQLTIHGRCPGGSLAPEQIAQLQNRIVEQLNHLATQE